MSNYDYNEYVVKHFNNYVKITLSNEILQKVDSFITDLIKRKLSEGHHKTDNRNEEKRWTTGMLGECAVEKFIGKQFIDWTIGDSSFYHTPDLSKLGVKCGVKTVERGKFPIIFKKSYKPEIIVIKISDEEFLICGLATVDVLNTYQSDELVLSPFLRRRGTKTGFFGFNKLLLPSKIIELIN